MDLPNISRLLENLVRIGTVHSVDHAKRRCRVQSGNLTTQWLKWMSMRAGNTATWDPPTVGEQAIVLSPSGELANGIVFYGIDSDAHPLPSTSPDKHVIAYPDGARIEYDHATHHLEAVGIQTATIQAATSITLDTPITHCTDQLVVDGLLTYKNGIRGTGGGNGNTMTGGLINTGGTISSNGIVLDTHTHLDPQGGDVGAPR